MSIFTRTGWGMLATERDRGPSASRRLGAAVGPSAPTADRERSTADRCPAAAGCCRQP